MSQTECEKTRLRTRTNLGIEQVDGELVILDKANNRIHQLNATASEVWSRLENGKSESTIVDELVELFNVSYAVARRDVTGLMNQFRLIGLLETAGSE